MRIGRMLIAIAVLHVLVGAVLYRGELLTIVADGLVASARERNDQALALWVLLSGIAVLLLGACVLDGERRGLPLPVPLALGLLVLTAAVVVPVPTSGAWAIFPLAYIAWRRAPRTASSGPFSAPPPAAGQRVFRAGESNAPPEPG